MITEGTVLFWALSCGALISLMLVLDIPIAAVFIFVMFVGRLSWMTIDAIQRLDR